MAKKPAGDTDALVTQALLNVATADRPPRLAGKGDTPALFQSKAGANKAAIDALAAFVAVDGKGADEAVRLTPAGFNKVAAQIPDDRIGPAAKAVAAALPTAERVAFLQDIVGRTPVAAPELQAEYEAALAAEQAEDEAEREREARAHAREQAARAAIARWLELSDERVRRKIAGHLQAARALGWTGDTTPAGPTAARGEMTPPKPEPRGSLKPTTREDADFRRDVAERLVGTWLDAAEQGSTARGFLETAMDNLVGLKRVGEEGDEVPFDGALHEAIPGVFTDHPVKVTRSGWALEEDADREYVIQKAQVAKT